MADLITFVKKEGAKVRFVKWKHTIYIRISIIFIWFCALIILCGITSSDDDSYVKSKYIDGSGPYELIYSLIKYRKNFRAPSVSSPGIQELSTDLYYKYKFFKDFSYYSKDEDICLNKSNLRNSNRNIHSTCRKFDYKIDKFVRHELKSFKLLDIFEKNEMKDLLSVDVAIDRFLKREQDYIIRSSCDRTCREMWKGNKLKFADLLHTSFCSKCVHKVVHLWEDSSLLDNILSKDSGIKHFLLSKQSIPQSKIFIVSSFLKHFKEEMAQEFFKVVFFDNFKNRLYKYFSGISPEVVELFINESLVIVGFDQVFAPANRMGISPMAALDFKIIVDTKSEGFLRLWKHYLKVMSKTINSKASVGKSAAEKPPAGKSVKIGQDSKLGKMEYDITDQNGNRNPQQANYYGPIESDFYQFNKIKELLLDSIISNQQLAHKNFSLRMEINNCTIRSLQEIEQNIFFPDICSTIEKSKNFYSAIKDNNITSIGNSNILHTFLESLKCKDDNENNVLGKPDDNFGRQKEKNQDQAQDKDTEKDITKKDQSNEGPRPDLLEEVVKGSYLSIPSKNSAIFSLINGGTTYEVGYKEERPRPSKETNKTSIKFSEFNRHSVKETWKFSFKYTLSNLYRYIPENIIAQKLNYINICMQFLLINALKEQNKSEAEIENLYHLITAEQFFYLFNNHYSELSNLIIYICNQEFVSEDICKQYWDSEPNLHKLHNLHINKADIMKLTKLGKKIFGSLFDYANQTSFRIRRHFYPSTLEVE